MLQKRTKFRSNNTYNQTPTHTRRFSKRKNFAVNDSRVKQVIKIASSNILGFSRRFLQTFEGIEFSDVSGLAGSHVGHTIASIGSLVGGMFAPHQAAESKDRRTENTRTDDDNIISLTVSWIFVVT